MKLLNMKSNVAIFPVPSTVKTISVIMVSYHTGPALLEAVNAVLRDKSISEVIIVDNGNTDAMRKSLSDYIAASSRVRLLQGHGNIGFGRGCNYGAGLANSDYLLFLNPDAIISEGAAMRMANASTDLTAPWVLGAMLRSEHGIEQRGGRRRALTPWTALTTFTGLSKLPGVKGINMHEEPAPSGLVKLPTVSGAAFMMDRASFDRLGGFDERYFLHVEDIDLCRRARLAGGDVAFLPSASVLHYGGTSKVRRQVIEREKLKGFVRYFWNYSDKIWAKALCAVAVPFMTVAILGRSWGIALKQAIAGRPQA